jgi:hypothetical protein
VAGEPYSKQDASGELAAMTIGASLWGTRQSDARAQRRAGEAAGPLLRRRARGRLQSARPGQPDYAGVHCGERGRAREELDLAND